MPAGVPGTAVVEEWVPAPLFVTVFVAALLKVPTVTLLPARSKLPVFARVILFDEVSAVADPTSRVPVEFTVTAVAPTVPVRRRMPPLTVVAPV